LRELTVIDGNRWQLTARQAESYERVKVPRLFGPMAARFLERIPLRPGQRVLDVACGTGIVARLAASQVGPSGSVTGLDLNADMLAVASGAAAAHAVPVHWRQGDAAALPFPDACFDAVLCQQGLQFFSDRALALREMRRVAVSGGIVAVCVFGPPSAYNAALAEGLGRYSDEETARRCLAPFALADERQLRSVMAEAGLHAIEMHATVLERRVEPTQEWLLQDSAGLPYAPVLADMEAATRAAFMREIAARLKEFWERDAFVVPTPLNVALARK
jgi:ubiquinone/menaquinone biosynthesis C-methylase UbiE